MPRTTFRSSATLYDTTFSICCVFDDVCNSWRLLYPWKACGLWLYGLLFFLLYCRILWQIRQQILKVVCVHCTRGLFVFIQMLRCCNIWEKTCAKIRSFSLLVRTKPVTRKHVYCQFQQHFCWHRNNHTVRQYSSVNITRSHGVVKLLYQGNDAVR